MASRIYPDGQVEYKSNDRFDKTLWGVDFTRYWVKWPEIYPIIAKGNIFNGIETKW